MNTPLPQELKAIIDDANFAHLATVDEAGHPHVTAMWIMRDGESILFNSLKGRAKLRHMERDPRVAISISPGDDPYLNFAIRGRVTELRTSDGREVIDRLAQKYMGEPKAPFVKPGDIRVTIVVEPTRIVTNP
jgi:PPOX class probable F420-dependent enzyme